MRIVRESPQLSISPSGWKKSKLKIVRGEKDLGLFPSNLVEPLALFLPVISTDIQKAVSRQIE